MTTFVVSFVVIERLLPRLYRQEFYAEYERLMVELELEITAELERTLMTEITHEIETTWSVDTEALRMAYDLYCAEVEQRDSTIEEFGRDEDEYTIMIEEGDWEIEEVVDWELEREWRTEGYLPWELTIYRDFCQHLQEEMALLHQEAMLVWEGIHWFHLRAMRDHHLQYDSRPFTIAEEMLRYFAMTNNVMIIVWEIEPVTEHIGEVLLEIDGRVNESSDDPMIDLGNERIAILQQNHYHPATGGFAIALTGTFQPAYRVLNIISTLFMQILIAIFFVSIVISALLSRYLARPIVRLSEESKKLTKLQFEEKLKIKRRDEIGDLSSNLNFMSYELQNALDDLQEANEKLKAEMEREREQERQRRNLFTSISHELKTPITILKGQIGGMVDKVGAYKDRDTYLERAYGWTESLEKLVSEILTISRLEGEKMRLNITRIDISMLLAEICHTHQTLADNQNISFNQQIATGLTIQADASQLQIAISNVINNAVFYTPLGKLVEVQLKKDDGFATLIVTNTGAHIEEEDLKNLFNPFYRVDKSRNRHTGGSGLGLFIVKSILELHGFGYSIENIVDGVRFTIRMPLE